MTVEDLADEGLLSRVSEQIALSSRRDHWLPITLLCLSACRFSELKLLDLGAVIDQRPQSIIMPKTKQTRLISGVYVSDRADKSTLSATTKVLHTNYESLRIEMLRCTPSNIRTILKFQNDKTHIFRHLRASFMSWKGVPTEKISEYFAHQSVEATREYINTGLFPIFNKNH